MTTTRLRGHGRQHAPTVPGGRDQLLRERGSLELRFPGRPHLTNGDIEPFFEWQWPEYEETEARSSETIAENVSETQSRMLRVYTGRHSSALFAVPAYSRNLSSLKRKAMSTALQRSHEGMAKEHR